MKANKYGLGILAAALLCGFEANAYEAAARNAILMDYDTGEYRKRHSESSSSQLYS